MSEKENQSVTLEATRELAEAAAGESTDALTGHCYDGIEEYDNPLPGWWKWLFAVTVLFAPPYYIYYHSGTAGRSLIEIHDAGLAENMKLQFAEIGELEPNRATLVRYMHDDSWVKVGQSVFKTNCVSCHGNEGGGSVGPNLTDDSYKNVKEIEDIARVVSRGAGRGAMPAWQTRLSLNEIVLVSAYVASLRGANPGPSPKGPEGQKIDPWPTLEELEAEAAPAEGEAEEEGAAGAEEARAAPESQTDSGSSGDNV